MDKKCRECGVEKSLDCFYAHSQMKDGHLSKCKECVRDRVTNHRARNIKKIRAYDRARGRLESRKRINRIRGRERYEQYKIARREWAKRNKIKMKEARERSNNRYPLKSAARNKLSNAIRDKKIFKTPCEVCGDTKVEGHHDDYAKPLEVRWLCIKHHKELHRIYKD
jgi:hypothetical protein